MTTFAILAALVLAACTGSPGVDTGDTPSAVATPTSSAAASGSASPTGDEETSAATATASPSDGSLGDAQECENEELGYEVGYPEDWWANERIEPDEPTLTPIPECMYFAREPVDLQPNAGLPGGLAVHFDVREGQEAVDPELMESYGEILGQDDDTVDGRPATVWETEATNGTSFTPAGSRTYQYVIELEDGSQLVAITDSVHQDEEDYEATKPILDAMMDSLELDD